MTARFVSGRLHIYDLDAFSLGLSLSDTLPLFWNSQCEVVSGVTIVHPIIEAPGFKVRSLVERTVVKFAQNPGSILQAYVDSGEGMDRAGGFAIQGRASILVRSIEGDYNNVVGFPLFSFAAFLHEMTETEELTFV